jgi:cAMP-dependent protein kinase regulator
VSPEDLRRATRRLRAKPLDHGAWLEVAALLGALGNADDADAAFATIGEGARIGGQVALAVACARHLAELGSVRGGELIDQVVESYAERRSQRAKTSPPVPSGEISLAALTGGAPVVPEAADPIEDARAVVATLGAWMIARKVLKVPVAPLLSALSKSGARALIGVMTARAVPAGKVVIEVGEPATALYWIAHGTVTIARPQGDGWVDLGELHSGGFFGEIALVGGTRRTARVTARDDSWLLEIPARAIENAAQKQPGLAEVLATHARHRLLANLVRTSELFRALAETDRDALLEKFTTELVPAGAAIIEEGKPNLYLWVVVSGKCVVQSAAASTIAELGPGAAVGEISLVSGRLPMADVVAQEQAVLLRLSKADFDVVAKKHPALLAEVEKLVLAREAASALLLVHDASDLIV